MTTMQAVIVRNGKGPAENLIIGEVEKPSPREGEVLVKIRAFGVNRMDIMQREGMYPVPPGAPTTLGVEFSGTVVEQGGNCSLKWESDAEVMGLALGGAYAEYICVPETHVMRKPVHLSWEEAASIPESFLTAYQALVLIAQCQPGDNVLIHAGASGVGIAAAQLARFLKAQTVTATTSTQAKIDFLLGMANGPTHAVNYKTQNFLQETQSATAQRGVDVILDFVGRDHWEKNMASCGRDARVVLLALMGGHIIPEFNLVPILFKRLHIEGSTLRSRSAKYQTDLIARFQQDILGEITSSSGGGKICTYIHQVFPFSNIQQAHKVMESNVNIGKLVVTVP